MLNEEVVVPGSTPEEVAMIDNTDDAEVDAVIKNSMDKLRAEQPGAAVPPETAKPPEAPAPASAEAPQPPEEVPPAGSQTEKLPVLNFRQPNWLPTDNDETYAIRTEMAKLTAEKSAAATTEEKDAIQEKLKDARSRLGTVSAKINRAPSNNDGAPSNVQPPAGQQPPEGAQPPAPDVAEIVRKTVAEELQRTQHDTSVRTTLEAFLDSHAELKDPDIRQAYFEFIDDNFNWSGKTGKELSQVLELAHGSMFRPAETVQERVLKGADVQNKVNAMQFPGGTVVRNGLSPSQQKSVDEMVATGMSEEKARALITD